MKESKAYISALMAVVEVCGFLHRNEKETGRDDVPIILSHRHVSY